jgi:hypothetical protein
VNVTHNLKLEGEKIVPPAYFKVSNGQHVLLLTRANKKSPFWGGVKLYLCGQFKVSSVKALQLQVD